MGARGTVVNADAEDDFDGLVEALADDPELAADLANPRIMAAVAARSRTIPTWSAGRKNT